MEDEKIKHIKMQNYKISAALILVLFWAYGLMFVISGIARPILRFIVENNEYTSAILMLPLFLMIGILLYNIPLTPFLLKKDIEVKEAKKVVFNLAIFAHAIFIVVFILMCICVVFNLLGCRNSLIS